MSKPELTKKLIADTLKKLMLTNPLDKISVQDIVKTCGLNRKTFYYHFQDKQELVCWIFDREFADLIDLNNNNSLIDELVEHLRFHKDFYVSALLSDVQNNLRDHLFKVVYDGIKAQIKSMSGEKEIAPDDMETISGYFSHAVMGCIIQWVREGMKTSLNAREINFHTITSSCLQYILNPNNYIKG